MTQPADQAHHSWTPSCDEEAFIDASREIFAAMAALLHEVEESRYVEPLGGFDPSR